MAVEQNIRERSTLLYLTIFNDYQRLLNHQAQTSIPFIQLPAGSYNNAGPSYSQNVVTVARQQPYYAPVNSYQQMPPAATPTSGLLNNVVYDWATNCFLYRNGQ